MHYQWQQAGLSIRLHVQPNASRDEISGIHNLGPEQCLKVRIRAPAVDGSANKHLVQAIAKWFGVRKNQVQIVKGKQSRQKIVHIDHPKTLPENCNIQPPAT